MNGSDAFLDLAGQAAVALLVLSMALTLWRLARGPTAADRVVALDLISVLVVAFIVAVSIITRESSYLDVAIAYACIAFLGTISLARFIAWTAKRRADSNEEERRE